MFQFYLNDILLEDEPNGWKEFSEVLERDESLKGFIIKYPGELTFAGDGYDILKSALDEAGYCQLIPLRILEQCGETSEFENAFIGNIILSDVKFNLSRCLATTSVVDNSYSAKIFNNKNIKANLSATKSKTGVTISAATTRLVDFFNPVDGVYTGNDRKVVDVFEAFKFLVAFMTDGEVAFASNYLSNQEDNAYFLLVTGTELRTFTNESMPIISFQELFDNIYKKFPIGFILENDGDENYTLRIEEESYFYDVQGSYKFNFIPNLQQSINTTLLYSGLKVGGRETIVYNPCRHSMVPSPILAFKESEFYFQTKCNIDSTLDLVSTYIIDTNIIEELVRSGISGELDCNDDPYGINDTYDDDTFLVQYTKTTDRTTPYDLLGDAPPYQYNGLLNNLSVIQRRNLLGNISQYFNQTGIDNSFYTEGNSIGEQIINGVIGTEIDFQADLGGVWINEISDPNNNYDTSTSTYTAPTDGYYKFEAFAFLINKFYNVDFDAAWKKTVNIEYSIGYIFNGNTFYFKGRYANYWQTGNVNATIYGDIDHILAKTYNAFYPVDDIAPYLDPLNIYMNTGDEIQFFIKVKPLGGRSWNLGAPGDPYPPFPDGTSVPGFMSRVNLRINPSWPHAPTSENLQDRLTTTVTPDGGGIVVEGSGSDYYSSLLNFSYPINKSDWKTLKTQFLNSFNANIDGVSNKVGWINKIERVIETGMSDVELISNLNNI